MQSLGERVIDEIGADKRLKMRLAELIISEPDVRLFIINSLLPNVAKREDVRELRSEITQLRGEMAQLRGEITQLRGEVAREIAQLRGEVHSNFKWTIGTMLTIWGATVIPILLRLIGAI
jgi:Rps23 Pro-64 3,4-dihydroxylase Tpa1-like proline 4-hydroxylase